MARKTKQQAKITRQEIIDAAIRTFSKYGVSSTSLSNIAEVAGVTRGAIYWHFKNKVDLFSEACKFTDEQIAETQKEYQLKYPNDPLFVLRKLLHYILFTFFDDTKNRELTEIFFHKCELIGEMAQFAELRREIYMINHQRLVTLLSACVEKKQLPVNIDAQCAAIMIRAAITGLFENWLCVPDSFSIKENAIRYVDTMIDMMKYSPSIRNN